MFLGGAPGGLAPPPPCWTLRLRSVSRAPRLSPALVVRGFRSRLFRPHFIFRMWHAHQPFIEPSHNIVEPLDPMPRLTRARQLVRLTRKHDHSSRTLQKLKRAEQLLSARVLRSTVVRLPQNEHYGCVDFLDERNRGAVGVVLRVLKRWRLEPVRLEQSEIGRIPPRGPIRYVALRYRGGKAVGLGNRPVSKYAPTTAAGHPEFFGINVAALEDFIHSRYQVAVVVARIVVLNDVAEILSVAGRAAWVDVKHHVALGRHPLKFVIEDPAIGGMWSAVDVED